MMKRLAGIGFMVVVCASSAMAEFSEPTGIYALGAAVDNPATAEDDRLAGIRDYDFVSGFTLRVLWRDLETAEGVYDFSVIDQALALAADVGQRVNLEILDGTPQYIVDSAAAVYLDHQGNTKPVPWDPFAQASYESFRTALATHVTTVDGIAVPLNENPTLAAVDATPVGLNFGVRDLNTGLRTHADYTQENYINAVVDGVALSRNLFPNHTGYLAFFGFDDGQAGTPVDEQILVLLNEAYNGEDQLELALFIENLSDLGPKPGIGAGEHLLSWSELGGSSLIQALDSWQRHRSDRDEQLASLNPATGIELAYEAYGTQFFELYVSDLDAAVDGALDANGNRIIDDLRYWNTLLTPEPGSLALIALGGLPFLTRRRRTGLAT